MYHKYVQPGISSYVPGMSRLPRYVYVDTYVPGLHPPKKKDRRPIDEIAKKKQNKKQPKYRAQPSKNRRPIDEIAKKKQSKKTT